MRERKYLYQHIKKSYLFVDDANDRDIMLRRGEKFYILLASRLKWSAGSHKLNKSYNPSV